MKEQEFCHFECAVAVRFSHRDFGLVVQPFDNAAGKRLARLEIVEQKLQISRAKCRDRHRLPGMLVPHYVSNVMPARAAALSKVMVAAHPAEAALLSIRQSAKSAPLDSNKRSAFHAISAS